MSKVPKIGWMRYRKSQDVLGEAKNITISESCGKWFVSIQSAREVTTPQHPSTSAVGMDWGVVHFVTLSNGQVVDQCQPLKMLLPKLAQLQRRMTPKIKFSKNWRKAKARITRMSFEDLSAHADFVGAVNIKEAGLALLACSQPSPAARASCQEPTEATGVQSCA